MSDNIIRFDRDDLLTAEDLADRLDCSVRTVYRKLKRGEVDAVETSEGTRYLLTPTDTDRPATDTNSVGDITDSATDTQRTPAPQAFNSRRKSN